MLDLVRLPSKFFGGYFDFLFLAFPRSRPASQLLLVNCNSQLRIVYHSSQLLTKYQKFNFLCGMVSLHLVANKVSQFIYFRIFFSFAMDCYPATDYDVDCKVAINCWQGVWLRKFALGVNYWIYPPPTHTPNVTFFGCYHRMWHDGTNADVKYPFIMVIFPCLKIFLSMDLSFHSNIPSHKVP